jgi:hypothetical protein
MQWMGQESNLWHSELLTDTLPTELHHPKLADTSKNVPALSIAAGSRVDLVAVSIRDNFWRR